MLVLKFLRFVFGYVSFSARGGFPERFINLCRRNSINLWELKSENSVIYACTGCGGYKKIRSVARKSGMKVRIEYKHGLPFFLNRHSRRAGVIVGICFCVAVICILSTRIWSIDVTGNVRVPAEEIIGVFDELGVRKGASGKQIDIKSVEISALQRLPELSWLNINIDGSAARIEVRERVETPDITQDDKPSDIVAAKDGQIVILRPFNGTQEQKIGNAVLKGDLLISGIEENKDLTVSFCRASGYVVARTDRNISVEQKSELKVCKTVSQKNTYIINFLFFSFPLGKTGDNAYREKSELFINGVTLPVGITKCTETVNEESTVNLNENQTQLLATLRFFDKCTEEFRYLETEKSEITASQSKNGCAMNGKFVCIENIGEEIPMEIEEGNAESS